MSRSRLLNVVPTLAGGGAFGSARPVAVLVAVLVAALLAVGSAGCGGAEPASLPETKPAKQIAYANRLYGNNDINVMSVDGSGRKSLTRTAGRTETSPAWSPDGRMIAFVVDVELRRIGIDLMNADGSGVREVTRHPWDDSPAWSPDGQEIAFVRKFEEPHRSRIYVLNLADLGVRPLISRDCTASCYDSDPAWSPDGRMIAITRMGPAEYLPSGLVVESSWIYVLHADGTGARRLTHGPASQDPPPGRLTDG